ncbi:MAG: TetR/AcrR family transcriptional regulator [Alphaproteobacteria bacterium]
MNERADKRSQILDAALKLFSERGFHGTAVPDIARAAGIGTGTIYRYFPDKEGLVNALYQHWRARFNAAVLAPMPAGLSPRAQFDLYWQRLVGFVQEQPIAARFLELHHHADYLNEASKSVGRIYPAAMRTFVRTGIGAGILRTARPEALIALMQGAMLGLLKQDEAASGGVITEQLVDETGACLWRAIAA